MIRISHLMLQEAKSRLKNIVFSHSDTHKIREGWQMGMCEKELTNYDGQGASIRVIGKTPLEVEAMALIVVKAIRELDMNNIVGGVYDNRGNLER